MNSERTTVNLVVGFLGLVVLFGMGIGGYLAVFDKGVPDFIVATTSGAIGALGAMLAKTSTGPTAVQVVNEPAEAVPVAETPKPKRARGDAGLTLLEVIVIALCVAVVLMLVGKL